MIKLCNYIRDLLDYPTEKIILGRENATEQTFTEDYIVVDNLNIYPSSHSSFFDGTLEKMVYYTFYEGSFTIEFYGLSAEATAQKFIDIQSCQKGLDLQKVHELTVYRPTSLNNLKQRAGGKYFNRVEIELKCSYNTQTEIEQWRIAQIPINYIKG